MIFMNKSASSSLITKTLHSSWLLPLTLGVLYFLLQLTQIGQYGASWDEPLHRNWGQLFAFFWKTGNRTALELMPGHGIDYGPLFYVANYLLSGWLFAKGYLTFVAANHVLTLLTASFVVSLMYVLGRMIGGWKMGVVSTMFLVFFPQFLAHSHYNPKDIPLMAAVIMTSIVFLRALRLGSVRAFVLAGFCMGIAIAAKISALIMAPVFAVTYGVWLFVDMRAASVRSWQKQFQLLALTILAVFGGSFLFWPSAWGDPLLLFRALHTFFGSDFWPGRVLFFGKVYSGAELPWYYIPFEIFSAFPALSLISIVVGVYLACRALLRKEDTALTVFILLWAFFPIFVTSLPGVVRYDGMRQFFFVVPALCLLAGGGFLFLLKLLTVRSRRSSAVPVFIGLVFVSLIGEVFTLHPYEGSYRNEIMRTLYPERMDRIVEVEYWGATYVQGLAWLEKNAEQNAVICVPIAGALMDWYATRPDFRFACDATATHVMFFTRFTEARAYDKLTNPVFTISKMNAALLNIYKL